MVGLNVTSCYFCCWHCRSREVIFGYGFSALVKVSRNRCNCCKPDPGAERMQYDAEFDVRDLISLTEVMTEYDLGPNGAQILAADLLAAQAGDVAEQLHALSGELMIVDTRTVELLPLGKRVTT